MGGIGPTCPACGKRSSHRAWRGYFSPCCGVFSPRLYRREHVDPARAARMTLPDIQREYADAGVPFRAAKSGVFGFTGDEPVIGEGW